MRKDDILMSTERKVCGYYIPIRRESEMQKTLDINSKAIGKIGFCIGILGVGGYFLYKKVNDLSKEVKKMKEEMRK